jgi:hypothetical protein
MNLDLTATVVRIELGAEFTDRRPRVTLKVNQADAIANEIRLAVDELPNLGQRVELVVHELAEAT